MTKGSEYKLWLWARCVKPDEMLDLSNTTHTHTHSNIYNNIQRSCFSIYIYTLHVVRIGAFTCGLGGLIFQLQGTMHDGLCRAL